jgi:hypothetical protein
LSELTGEGIRHSRQSIFGRIAHRLIECFPLTKGIEARQAQRKLGYSSAYDIATLCADLGDKDQAFRWLNAAYQERDTGLLRLKTDFLLDPLRPDPRFAELHPEGGQGGVREATVMRARAARGYGLW